ncbi:MAG: hypothetical protein ACYCOY_06455 [Metallibacterium sp.]
MPMMNDPAEVQATSYRGPGSRPASPLSIDGSRDAASQQVSAAALSGINTIDREIAGLNDRLAMLPLGSRDAARLSQRIDQLHRSRAEEVAVGRRQHAEQQAQREAEHAELAAGAERSAKIEARAREIIDAERFEHEAQMRARMLRGSTL